VAGSIAEETRLLRMAQAATGGRQPLLPGPHALGLPR